MKRSAALMLAVFASSTLAAPVTQAAVLKAVKVQGNVVTLTLDYVDLFTDSAADAARVVALGDYRSADAYYDAHPSGLYVRNTNPQLRTLKADTRTIFELSCMNAEGSIGPKAVPLNTFLASWRGQQTPCWNFDGRMVTLRLEGTRVLKVSQVYFP